MKGRAASTALAMLAMVVTGPVVAGQAGQQTAASDTVVVNDVIVREVEVREVRVPSAPRPSSAMPRPFLPDAISRPNQGHFVSPAERQSSTRRSRDRGAAVVGYPVGFPVYPFVFEPPPYGFPNPTSYPTPAGIAPPTPNNGSPPGLVAGTPWFAAIECGVSPDAPAPCGGLSFEVSPADAQVSVEGIFVGAVDAFSPARAPLVLAPGVHYIEVRRPGYRTETFEVTIGAGAIMPYRGALEPLRTR